MDIHEEKKILRKLIRERKKLWSTEQKRAVSANIFEQVEQLEVFRNAYTILAYWSMSDEVHTHNFIMKWYRDKRILLPIVAGDVLDLHVFEGMQSMVEGTSYGILEPLKGPAANAQDIDLAIIPGIAFDSKGNRLGRGKAYYDKLLKQHSFEKIGVCFDFQMVEKVPTGPFDIAMDKVIFG